MQCKEGAKGLEERRVKAEEQLTRGRPYLDALLGAESRQNFSRLITGLKFTFLSHHSVAVEITPLALSSASTLRYLNT